MQDAEVEEIMKACAGQEDEEGFIKYENFVKNVFAGPFPEEKKTQGESLYVVLGLPKTCTQDEIKKTYRKDDQEDVKNSDTQPIVNQPNSSYNTWNDNKDAYNRESIPIAMPGPTEKTELNQGFAQNSYRSNV
ncbi:hypothetical protein RND71_043395 [Anisodus tanguticus]|uniref:Uncharacterized protein n=1 Tax=Anisodus tanguticus TaxID=243964 RepID=A0AAE1QNI2_9SOLA|nr:hypothetical protein RND71_043395 [Anisodus tanguticus]